MARQSAPTAVTVKYDLFDLPTAQHKAGLAGLLLQIRHMERKSPKPKAIPKISELTRTSATVEFNRVVPEANELVRNRPCPIRTLVDAFG